MLINSYCRHCLIPVWTTSLESPCDNTTVSRNSYRQSTNMYEPHIVELKRIKYRVLRILPFSSLLSVFTLVLYLAYRAKSIIAASAIDGYHAIALNSTLYYIAELGLFSQLPFPPFRALSYSRLLTHQKPYHPSSSWTSRSRFSTLR